MKNFYFNKSYKNEILYYLRLILIILVLVIFLNIELIILLRLNIHKNLHNRNFFEDSIAVENVLDKPRSYTKCSNKIKTYILDEIYKKDFQNQNKRIVLQNMYYNNIYDKIAKNIIVDNSNFVKEIVKIRKQVYRNSKYFPVMDFKDNKTKENGANKGLKKVFYENSWDAARNYGGNRKHEGTDIMSLENKPDKIPIVSISDGIIEKKGWLELGGYRLYIKVSDRLYMYYAHLSSYEPTIKEGDKVYAGQILGYMGNTGYGEEGTKGKFDTHLHFGIYYKDKNNVEKAINPYYLLKFLENRKLFYKEW